MGNEEIKHQAGGSAQKSSHSIGAGVSQTPTSQCVQEHCKVMGLLLNVDTESYPLAFLEG